MIAKNVKYDANGITDKSTFYHRANNGKKTLTKQAEAVLWYMRDIIGISEITKDNTEDVFKRIEQFEDLFGAAVVFWEDDSPVNNAIERDDIVSFIGLKLKEVKQELDKDQWQNKISEIKSKRDAEELRISKQFEGVELPENPSIEQLAPGAEIHTRPLIDMPNFAKGGSK